MVPSEFWGEQKEWPPKSVEFKRTGFDLKTKLEKMNMEELREFAKKNNLKSKDTNKKELIIEIINEMEDKK